MPGHHDIQSRSCSQLDRKKNYRKDSTLCKWKMPHVLHRRCQDLRHTLSCRHNMLCGYWLYILHLLHSGVVNRVVDTFVVCMQGPGDDNQGRWCILVVVLKWLETCIIDAPCCHVILVTMLLYYIVLSCRHYNNYDYTPVIKFNFFKKFKLKIQILHLLYNILHTTLLSFCYAKSVFLNNVPNFPLLP